MSDSFVTDVPSPLPSGWPWTRVDDVFLVTRGVQKSPKRQPVKNHYPYLRVANVQRGQLDLTEIERFELARIVHEACGGWRVRAAAGFVVA
jgi:hypothetical protein